MLSLLRKYQKSIFILTAVVVISTFVFYGAMRSNRGMVSNVKSVKESVLYKTPQGEKVTDAQVHQMSHFLNEEVDHLSPTPMNLFNGQFISKYLFEMGMGSSLAEIFFAEIEAPFKAKFEKMQNYQPYAHPYWPVMSSEKIWEMFTPSLSKAYIEFKSYKAPSKEAFIALQKLFVESEQMPSSFLQQILASYQNQNPRLPKDPALYNQDLALFHAHSLSDWFGKEYLDLVSQFVLNTASAAKEKKISFTAAEVRASFIQNGIDFMHTYGGKEVTPSQVETLLQTFCFQRQCTEREMLNLYEKVMLCKAYLERGHSIVFDPAFYQDYMKEAAQKVKVSLCKMSPEFQIKSSLDGARVESYLNALFPEGAFNDGKLPSATLPIANIKDESPELVSCKVVVNLSSITKDEAKHQISLKDLWDYQTGDLGWKKVIALVPAAKDVGTKGERYAFIKGLSPEKKAEVDEACKKEIVEKNPKLMITLLDEVPLQEKTLIVVYGAKNLPLQGFQSAEDLLETLAQAKEPTIITKDGLNFYKVSLVRMGSDEIMTFQEAKKEGTLDLLMERNLLSFFESQKHKFPEIKNSSFDEVKEIVAQLKYPSAKGLFSTYLVKQMDVEMELLAPLFTQFLVKKETETWSRAQNKSGAHSGVWDKDSDSSTKLVEMNDGSLVALKVLESFEDQKAIEDAIAKGRKHLENVAKKEVADAILADMKEQHTFARLSYE